MAAMTPLRRVSGNQHLHCKSDEYRDAVRRKIAAYHRHIQLGLIATGLLQILSATKPTLVWQSFGSWIRTVRPGLAPSEQVVAIALRNRLPEFLASAAKPSILVKFIRDRLDLSRTEGTSLAVQVAKPCPIGQLRAGELRRVSEQEIGQRRTGTGVVGRGAEDGAEDRLSAAIHRVEAAPAHVAAHL